MSIEKAMNDWEENVRQKSLKASPEKKQKFRTLSGYDTKPLYTPLDQEGTDYLRDIGFPGQAPFTRGRMPNGYRSFVWHHDFYSGYGSSENANKRLHDLVCSGANDVTLALDLPSQIGLDSDDPMAEGEVGKAGVALASLADVDGILDGIDLRKVGLGFVTNSIGAYGLSLALALAEKRGIEPTELRQVRIQNDPLKEYSGRGTYIFPVTVAIELAADVVEFVCRNFDDKVSRQWAPQYVCATQFRWGGASAAQEIGFGIAHFLTYIEAAMKRGLSINQLVPRMDLHCTADADLFEEVAKFRAARRLWARIIKARYNSNDPRVLGLRITVFTAGNRLLAQQPLNNLARVSMQVLACILGGVEAISAPAYDEALALPTLESTQLSQQMKYIIGDECGLENVIDPMGGSYYLEKLTNQIEEEARYWLDKVESLGGVAAAIQNGLYSKEQLDGLYRYQKEVESGDRLVVGINKFAKDEEIPIDLFEGDPAAERRQIERIERLRAERSNALVRERLEQLGLAAANKADNMRVNIVPAILEAVKVYATVGEIYGVLKKVFGEYEPSLNL
ncbi:MAG: methylmalonyl-CoA mutase family protein [Dehalococcoidia bacterium]|nr:methylmalonyl-CoA mutase family protein [Dehalococcoidia bacterium]